MGVSGVSGANSMMADMMQILLQGFNEQMDMSKQMIAVGVENEIISDKMATAQQIIDTYA